MYHCIIVQLKVAVRFQAVFDVHPSANERDSSDRLKPSLVMAHDPPFNSWPSTEHPTQWFVGYSIAWSPCAQGVALSELHLFHATAIQHGRRGVDGGVGPQWVWGHLCYKSSQQYVSHSRLHPFCTYSILQMLPRCSLSLSSTSKNPTLNNATLFLNWYFKQVATQYLRSTRIQMYRWSSDRDKACFPTVSSSILPLSRFPTRPFRGFRGCRCHAEGHASTISAILLRWDWET